MRPCVVLAHSFCNDSCGRVHRAAFNTRALRRLIKSGTGAEGGLGPVDGRKNTPVGGQCSPHPAPLHYLVPSLCSSTTQPNQICEEVLRED